MNENEMLCKTSEYKSVNITVSFYSLNFVILSTSVLKSILHLSKVIGHTKVDEDHQGLLQSKTIAKQRVYFDGMTMLRSFSV
jgi:hypothetical protein